MSIMCTMFRTVVLVVTLVLVARVGIGGAADLPQFDDAMYKALVDTSSAATITPGTTITMQNWQQYKQFMPVGLQLLFSGDYSWKMPQDVELDVGPTIPIPLPKLYLQNAEKYSGQVTLAKTPDGGYIMKNYIAGLPFPSLDPKDPLYAYKIMYNEYERYICHVHYNHDPVYTKDRFGNVQSQELFTVYRRLNHLSSPGVPIKDPKNDGYDMIQYIEVIAPEQSRYATTIKTFSDDPTVPENIFSYTPSLRRAIRLSSQSRCAPATGGDNVFDDTRAGFGIHPINFSARNLGEKKILLMEHVDTDRVTEPVLGSGLSFYASTVYQPLLFPKPMWGKWEVRNEYIQDYRMLPAAGAESYCYGSRLIYLDAESFMQFAIDLYDVGLKYWKFDMNFFRPEVIPNTGGDVAVGDPQGVQAMWNLQEGHLTNSVQAQCKCDSEVDLKYRDNIERYGWPSGLDQITQ